MGQPLADRPSSGLTEPMRLDALPTKAMVRAIVVLRSAAKATSEKRPAREQRQALAKVLRESARSAFDQLDAVLHEIGGPRLQDEPNALGTVLVEAPPSGVAQLAKSDIVTAVMEDQRISTFLRPE